MGSPCEGGITTLSRRALGSHPRTNANCRANGVRLACVALDADLVRALGCPYRRFVITLYDNPFSPFARKVRLALRCKELPFTSVDALAHDELQSLARKNPRVEVPVLADGDLIVRNSAEIVAYLDDRYGSKPLLPEEPELRVRAREWQRIADSVMDAILHDISLWFWPTHQRTDSPPKGLYEAGKSDLLVLLSRFENDLLGPFVCGEAPSVADIAVYPHITSLKLLGIELDPTRHPRVLAWMRSMRDLSWVKADQLHIKEMSALRFFAGVPLVYEGKRVVWRGDRIEWLFARGFANFWIREHTEGRAVLPPPL